MTEAEDLGGKARHAVRLAAYGLNAYAAELLARADPSSGRVRTEFAQSAIIRRASSPGRWSELRHSNQPRRSPLKPVGLPATFLGVGHNLCEACGEAGKPASDGCVAPWPH